MARQKRKLADFGKLWPAEALILAGLDDPHVTQIGDGKRPEADAPQDRRVRASFLRWCALGGDEEHRLHETGLQIAGALVASDGEADPFQGDAATPGLDLEGCEVTGDLGFVNCRFEHPPVLRAARIRNFFLNGSALPGLRADGLKTTGGVYFRKVETEGEVRLPGASIGGDLDFDDGTFSNEGGAALNADRLATAGGVFLRKAETEGEVCLLGASIGGNLSCGGGTFRNKDGHALNADGAKVTGALFWRDGVRADGALDLTAAQIGAINDVPADWPERGDLLLDRCEYGAFTGFGISGEERIDWLSRQNPALFGKDFWPQPWEQCAKVLREMGHAEDARAVLIDKERRQRADRRQRLAIRLEAARMRVRLADATETERGPLATELNERLGKLGEASKRDNALYYEKVRASRSVKDLFRQRETPDGHPAPETFRAEARAKLGMDRLGPPAAQAALAARAPVFGLWWAGVLFCLWDGVLSATVAYGHRPFRATYWLFALWLIGTVTFLSAWGHDAMKPNNPFVLRSAEWVACAVPANETVALEGELTANGAPKHIPGLRAPDETRLACFQATERGAGYPDFNAGIYAADVLLPIVQLEQQAAWVPDERAAPAAKAMVYVLIILGWALSLLAVAGFSGLVKSD